MKKSILIILIILLGRNFVFAQRLSARLDVGGSNISYDKYPHASYYRTSAKPSFNLGIGLNKPLTERSGLNFDLLISNINGKIYAFGIIDESNQDIVAELPLILETMLGWGPFTESTINRNAFICLQPEYYITKNTFKVYIGGRLGIMVYHHVKTDLRQRTRWVFGYGNTLFGKIDYGLSIGTIYPINSKTNLKLNYYQGLCDFTKNYSNRIKINNKNRQFTIGIEYQLKDYAKQKK